jgi:recombination protein RecR
MAEPMHAPDPIKPTSATQAPAEGAARSRTARPKSGASSRVSAGVGGFSQPTGYPEAVDRLINELARLPGIGRRSAERLALHLLKSESAVASSLASAIGGLKGAVRNCRVCFNLTEQALCAICADARRDRSVVMVVEQPRDVLALESTGAYRGLYHVLLGRLSPLDGIGPSDLTIPQLWERLDDAGRNAGGVAVGELILGLNPTMEGDGTSLYLSEQCRRRKVRVTRLARGLPTGGTMEFASKAVLADAIAERRGMMDESEASE